MKYINKKSLLFRACVVLVSIFLFKYYIDRDVIAKVGSIKIYKDELLQELKYRGINSIDDSGKEIVLNQLIDRKLFLNKAYELSLEDDPKIIRNFENMLIGSVKKRYIHNEIENIKITDEDIKEYYEKNKDEFFIPQKREFAILFFKKHKKERAYRKEQISKSFNFIIDLYNSDKLPSSKDGFGKYSIKYSEHQASRYRGGIIGWFRKAQMNIWEERVLKRGFELKELGEMSDIIETDRGYYLIRLTNLVESKYKELKSTKRLIRHKLILEKQTYIKSTFENSLKNSFDISINHDRVNDINVSGNKRIIKEEDQELKPPSFN